MAGRLAGRTRAARRVAERATLPPLLVRAGVYAAALGALLVALPAEVVASRYAPAAALAALWPAVAPRGRGPAVVAVLAAAAWTADTTWFDARVALWRVLALGGLLYLGHSLAALAAVLPYDAAVDPAVPVRWVLRALAVVLGSSVLTVVALTLTARLAGPAFLAATLAGLAAATTAVLLLPRLLRRP